MWIYSDVVTYNSSKAVGNFLQIFTKFSDFSVSLSFWILDICTFICTVLIQKPIIIENPFSCKWLCIKSMPSPLRVTFAWRKEGKKRGIFLFET